MKTKNPFHCFDCIAKHNEIVLESYEMGSLGTEVFAERTAQQVCSSEIAGITRDYQHGAAVQPVNNKHCLVGQGHKTAWESITVA